MKLQFNPPLQWTQRLRVMDHSKGTSHEMMRKCMLAEILELRKQSSNLYRKLKQTTERADYWRGHTRRYQKELARLK